SAERAPCRTSGGDWRARRHLRASAARRTRRRPLISRCGRALADERFDPVDDVLDVETRRVDLDRISCGLHPRRVALVTQPQVGRQGVGADAGPLGDAAFRTLISIGDEEDLYLGVGSDDGADVAALDHDVPVAPELTLALAHHLAHRVVTSDDRHHPVY